MLFGRGRQVIGLDVGSHAVKLVGLKEARGGSPFQLTHFGIVELPGESIVEGSVVQPEPVARAIRELLALQKLRSARVATAVSGHAVIVRRVTLPRMEQDRLRESIRWEAEEHIPFDIDDVNLDFAVLDDGGSPEAMEVVLVAAKRDRIDECVAVIEQAGAEVAIVDVDAFALQNAFEVSYPDRQQEDVALLNLGASVINVAVLERGRPAFWRDITLGARQYVVALQREFALEQYDAEEVLRRSGGEARAPDSPAPAEPAGWEETPAAGAEEGVRDAATDPRVHEVIGEISERIIAEVKNTFDFYHGQAMRDGFDAVFLAGGGAYVRDLVRRLAERLGTPVEPFDPLRRVAIPAKSFDPDYVRSLAPQMAVAVGLAMRGGR